MTGNNVPKVVLEVRIILPPPPAAVARPPTGVVALARGPHNLRDTLVSTLALGGTWAQSGRSGVDVVMGTSYVTPVRGGACDDEDLRSVCIAVKEGRRALWDNKKRRAMFNEEVELEDWVMQYMLLW